MKTEIILVFGMLGLCLGCRVSMDCQDKEGRSLCYEKSCRRDVPCNKDNDCFFYGASDVSQGFPHPKCFLNKNVRSPPGYGICMLREYAAGLERLPGGDVVDAKTSRDVDLEAEALEKLYKII